MPAIAECHYDPTPGPFAGPHCRSLVLDGLQSREADAELRAAAPHRDRLIEHIAQAGVRAHQKDHVSQGDARSALVVRSVALRNGDGREEDEDRRDYRSSAPDGGSAPSHQSGGEQGTKRPCAAPFRDGQGPRVETTS
jgi:hypothetical protein